DKAYLSLGDKEEKTKNPVMASVGNKIREACAILDEHNVSCILEWNPGNHFKDADIRTAKGFLWALQNK
nr:esterase [Lachnospiraceae bacterium]